MVFIWRGAGIIVPIIVLISGWLTSYSFEDTRLGNPDFMGWTLLWASIPILLVGLGSLGANMADPETGKVPEKSYNDFFFIPIWAWGVGLLALSMYFLFRDNGEEKDEVYSEEIPTVFTEPEVEEEPFRRVNFYNPQEDTLYLEVSSRRGDNVTWADVAPKSIKYFDFDAGTYSFETEEDTNRIKIETFPLHGSEKYDEAFYIFGGEYDLILANVTAVCSDTITKEHIRDIDWSTAEFERFSGDFFIAPMLDRKGRYTYTVKDPGFMLPTEHSKNELVYALFPIQKSRKVSDRWLEEEVINVSF